MAELTRREFKRILLIKLSALGDVVHTFALLNALRRRYPDARIDWLSKPSTAELIRHQPAVTNALVYGENHTEAPRYNLEGVLHWLNLMTDGRFLGLLRQLRSARYDLVVDVHGQMRTAFVTLVTGAPVRIGFGKPRPEVWQPAGAKLPAGTIQRAWKGAREGAWHAYTHHIPLDTLDLHAIDRYLKVGDLLGFRGEPADIAFRIPQSAEDRVIALLASAGVRPEQPLVVIAPAALWETKRWRPEGFAEVAHHCIGRGHTVVIAGSPAERGECATLAAAAPGAVDVSGQTSVVELAALLKKAAVCLTNDSGPMHIAAAMGRPVVSMFGPTNPTWVGPYGQPEAVVRAGTACSPCYLRDYQRCGFDHACMRNIRAADVAERIEAALAH